MKIITLNEEVTFERALCALLAGKCLGIRPNDNASYVVLYKPKWMNQTSPDYMLKWLDGGSDFPSEIRTNQFLGTWKLVIVDHRELTKETV